MFDIGWPEILIIIILLIVVMDSKELPGMLRTFGGFLNKMRSISRDFMDIINDVAKSADIRDSLNIPKDNFKSLDPQAYVERLLDSETEPAPIEKESQHAHQNQDENKEQKSE